MARQRDTDDGLRSGWSDVVADAQQMLAFERARAKSPVLALRFFAGALWRRLGRLQRLGWRRFGTLLAVERACAQAGLLLGSGSSDEGCCAPWHLSEHLLSASLADLPAHPLIDTAWLARLCAPLGAGVQPTALAALRMVLRSDGLPARWQGLRMASTTHTTGTVAGQPGPAGIAICLHLYYPEMWLEVAQALQALDEPWDLFVSVPRFAATPVLQAIAQAVPQAVFRMDDNQGRDVLPWLHWLAAGTFDRYEWVCKLHTKKSPHRLDGAQWRAQLFDGLLGSPVQLHALLAHLRQHPEIGLAGPQAALVLPGTAAWSGRNGRLIAALQTQLALGTGCAPLPFMGGTMFWFRPPSVRPLAALAGANFQTEMGQTDGTLAHAIERIIPQRAAQAGYTLHAIAEARSLQ